MQVKVEEIREEGLTLNEPIAAEEITAALDERGHETGFKAGGPARFKATLHKVSGGVLIEGNVDAPVTAPCKRCLTEVQLKLPITFTLNLVSEQELRKHADMVDHKED